MPKKTICLDFDGVLHSYKSGWQGPRTIADEPVPGAMAFLDEIIDSEKYEVCIYSSRSRYFLGRKAMKKWLRKWLFIEMLTRHKTFTADEVIRDMAKKGSMMEEEYLLSGIWSTVNKIKFPKYKPAAFLTIDDRAICFTGTFPTDREIESFVPWNKKG